VVPLGIGHVVAGRRAWARRTRDEETQHRVIEERLRIARELHDVISHSISMINVQAGVAAHVMEERPEQAREALLAIKGSSKEVLRELRAILGILRDVDEVDSKAPAPGLAQLDVLVGTITRAGLPTTVSLAGSARPLPPGIDLIAYRIVQESLTNVLRHAGPATVEVKVSYEGARVVIEVADDGQGIGAPTNGQGAGRGHGIAGMRERAAAVGGELEAGPRPVRGFRVRACLPYA
jgi:signal transduction histidine kinase